MPLPNAAIFSKRAARRSKSPACFPPALPALPGVPPVPGYHSPARRPSRSLYFCFPPLTDFVPRGAVLILRYCHVVANRRQQSQPGSPNTLQIRKGEHNEKPRVCENIPKLPYPYPWAPDFKRLRVAMTSSLRGERRREESEQDDGLRNQKSQPGPRSPLHTMIQH